MEIAKNWIDNQQVARMGNYKGRKLSIIIPVNGNSVTKNVDCFATEKHKLYTTDQIMFSQLGKTNCFHAPIILKLPLFSK